MNQVEKNTLNEDEMFSYTHTKRKQLVEHMLQNGIPGELDDKKFLSMLLKDMDSQALGRMRIKIDEKTNATQEHAAALIAKVLGAVQNTSTHTHIEATYREIPRLPSDIPNPVLVDGEVSVVGKQLSYEEFVTIDIEN